MPSLNGRNSNGTFAKGNSGGPGNPHSKQVNRLRSAILEAATKKDMQDIYKVMATLAKQGNVAAARFVYEYTAGKPIDWDASGALEALQILSQPIDILLNNMLLDPETRNELRKKLKAFDVADQDTGSSTPSEQQ